MAIQTLATVGRARARADRHRNRAADVVAKMRSGAVLHLCFTSRGPVWSLSDGTVVHPDIAKIVTTNVNIHGVGDSLFPRVAGCSQTFLWQD